MAEEKQTNLMGKALIYNYAIIRDAVDETRAKMKEMLDVVRQSDEYRQLENWLAINEQSISELSIEIQQLALMLFRENGDKKPFPGTSIREMKRYEYTMTKAVKWAKVNVPMLIQETVDKKQFEKIVSTMDPELLSVEDIHVFTEPIASIASDLEFAKEFGMEISNE